MVLLFSKPRKWFADNLIERLNFRSSFVKVHYWIAALRKWKTQLIHNLPNSATTSVVFWLNQFPVAYLRTWKLFSFSTAFFLWSGLVIYQGATSTYLPTT